MTLSHLEVWGDLWHVGGVFGGEARSMFEESGQAQCLDNPQLDRLIMSGLEITAEVGIRTSFWDEPEMKCKDHRGMDRLCRKPACG